MLEFSKREKQDYFLQEGRLQRLKGEKKNQTNVLIEPWRKIITGGAKQSASKRCGGQTNTGIQKENKTS